MKLEVWTVMRVMNTTAFRWQKITISLAASCLLFASCQTAETVSTGLPGPAPPHPSELGLSDSNKGKSISDPRMRDPSEHNRAPAEIQEASRMRGQSIAPVAYEASLSDVASKPPLYVGPISSHGAGCPDCATGSQGNSHTGTPVPGYAPNAGLPLEAWTGRPGDGYTVPGPAPYWHGDQPVAENWSPQMLARPWPRDEYLYDGGDKNVEVSVLPDFSVRGLNLEDTVAHYDTLDGEVVVEPSNRVPIYAPRFAAVRKVFDLAGTENLHRIAGTDQPLRLQQQIERMPATNVNQPVQPIGEVGLGALVMFKDRNRGVGTENSLALNIFDADLKASQNFEFLAPGKIQNHQKAYIAGAIDAAHAWSSDQAVQIVVDGTPAIIDTHVTTSGTVKEYETPPGRPLLRVLKMANKKEAKPGDIIEFTIRFDNLGNEPIGNVTVLDNLTARLEYVEGTADCSLEHTFFAQENEAASAVLRFEITNPMKVGDGGMIRFKCRVR